MVDLNGMQTQADQWGSQLEAQKKAVDQLIGNSRFCPRLRVHVCLYTPEVKLQNSTCRVLEQKLQEAKAKKDTLKARAASAKSTKEINEMLGSLSNSSNAYTAFEKMEEKVIAMEAESEAVGMLGGAAGNSDGLEAKFAMLEGTDTDAELVRQPHHLHTYAMH